MSETPQPNPGDFNRPTIDEELKAQESLTPEQQELSAVRQIFLEREPRIKDMPSDFDASPDLKTYSGGAGTFKYLQRSIRGAFDDRGTIVIRQRTPPASTNEKDLRWYGRAGDDQLPPEEAEELFNDLYPVAKAFSQMVSSEKQIREKYQQERNDQALTEREEKQERALHVEKTKQEAFAEGKTIGRYEGILESKLDGIEISEEDRDFIYDAISKIAVTASDSGMSRLMSDTVSYPRTDEEKQRKQKHQEDYARRKGVIKQLLGVVDGGVTWSNVGDFAGRYSESYTYSTIFPDLVFIAEDFDKSFGVASNDRYAEGHKKAIAERVVKAPTPVS